MLVLSRKVGQKVSIGYEVVVTILEVKRNRARLGIEGPSTMPIHRSEVSERIQETINQDSIDRFQDENHHM
jgi:carbon storage regulator